LRKHLIRNTYYTGSHFITRQDQEREQALRNAIQEYLDERWQDPTFATVDPQDVRQDIQNFVVKRPDLSWATKPYRLSLHDWLALYGSLIAVGALMLFSLLAPVVSAIWQGPPQLLWWSLGSVLLIYLAWPLLQKQLPSEPDGATTTSTPKAKQFSFKSWLLRLVLFSVFGTSLLSMVWNAFDAFANWPWAGVVFWGFLLLLVGSLLLLRRDERIPAAPIEPLSDKRIKEITVKEYHPVVNEMSVINVLKPGWIRPFFLGLTLRLVPLIRAFNYIPSVHTARWLQTDNGRRLVFIAYFDNTSEGYAHDFVDSTKRTRNLNLIFGHALGFPATRYAILDGGKDRRQYMLGVRKSQHLTGVWYNSHPELSITNVKNNRAIRKGLFGKVKEGEEVEAWLALL
jgi:membrane protein implicated in regulation of membrane protease activity